MFLDRMNGLTQPTSPETTVQSTIKPDNQPPHYALPTSPAGEFRGDNTVCPNRHMDLDPLDMGPLQVRVMMNDRTVHAHIPRPSMESWGRTLTAGTVPESSAHWAWNGHVARHRGSAAGRRYCVCFNNSNSRVAHHLRICLSSPAREDERATRESSELDRTIV